MVIALGIILDGFENGVAYGCGSTFEELFGEQNTVFQVLGGIFMVFSGWGLSLG